MNLKLITIFVMLLAAAAFATTAFIQPPKLSYTFHVKENCVNTFPGSVKIENRNDFPVTVVFSKPAWVDIVNSVALQIGESRNVSFNIVLTQSGSYSGDITAMYTAPGKLAAPASADIAVNAIYNGTFVNANPPNTPQLSAPADGYRAHAKILTLKWLASADPDAGCGSLAYYYYVDDNSNFASPEVFGSTLATQQEVELAYNTYYWKIVATDGKYNSSSAVRNFVIGNDPPSAPQLISPASNAQLGIPPVLEWSASSDIDNDAIRYEVLVDDDANFNVPIIKKTAERRYDLNGIISQGIWYWKVRADDGIAKSDSQVRSFTFGAAATTTSTTTTTQQIVCAADVFLCPDSSYVSRDPSNNCQFRPCSSTAATSTTSTTTTSTSTTSTTIPEETATTSTTTTTAPETMTISVLQGSSVEIAIIMFVVISTAISAAFILRR